MSLATIRYQRLEDLGGSYIIARANGLPTTIQKFFDEAWFFYDSGKIVSLDTKAFPNNRCTMRLYFKSYNDRDAFVDRVTKHHKLAGIEFIEEEKDG